MDVARILRPLTDNNSSILDAGCGEFGLSAFLSSRKVVGVDVVPSDDRSEGFTFIYGSIVSLPFAEKSFSAATSVDVLEHLPAEMRQDAIKELVMIAEKTIVVTFPCGQNARQIDETFYQELVDSNQPIPVWLAEHLENQYPDANAVLSEIEQEASRLGRKVRTTVFYSEILAVARFIRWSAVRSRYLYLLGNILTGVLSPILPGAKKNTAYRSILLTEFEND